MCYMSSETDPVSVVCSVQNTSGQTAQTYHRIYNLFIVMLVHIILLFAFQKYELVHEIGH